MEKWKISSDFLACSKHSNISYIWNVLKGHNTKHSGHMGQNLKTIEIQLIRLTEVCGKV